jgi:hypothetical protein
MGFPNTFHSAKWQLTFSNIPTVTDNNHLKYFDNYVKSIVVPDYNLTEAFSDFKGERIRHPVSRINEDMSQIQIEFKLSEDLFNYLYLLEWMQSLRYGQQIPTEMIRKDFITRINVHILDNEKRTVANLGFTDAFLLNLSSFSLDTGTDEEVTFTANFSYYEIKAERVAVITC